MDFINKFLKVHDFKSVFVIVDQLSKYTLFVPKPKACPTKEVVRLFFNNVVKYFVLLREIVSDRYAKFMERF